MNELRTTIGDREVEICEKHPGIFNAYDVQTGERLVVVVDVMHGWWFGARLGHPPRNFELDEGGVEEAVRSLIEAP